MRQLGPKVSLTVRPRLDCSTLSSNPILELPWCRFQDKREPVTDIDTAVPDGLKVLDPNGRSEEAAARSQGGTKQGDTWTYHPYCTPTHCC